MAIDATNWFCLNIGLITSKAPSWRCKRHFWSPSATIPSVREPPSIVLPIYPGSLSLVWIGLYVEVHLCWNKVRFWRAPKTSSDESFILSEQIQVKFGCHWPDLCPHLGNLYFYLISLALYSVGGTRLSSTVIYRIIISFLPISHKWPNVMIRLINLE